MPRLLKAPKFKAFSSVKRVGSRYSGPSPFGAKTKVGQKTKKLSAKKFKPFRNFTNQGV